LHNKFNKPSFLTEILSATSEDTETALVFHIARKYHWMGEENHDQ